MARGRRLPLGAVLCVLAVLLAVLAGGRADAANVVVLFTTPSSSNLWVGRSPIVVAEEIAPVGDPGLGSFDLEVTYNPAVLSVSVREGPFLSSTGNETTCVRGGAEGDLKFSCSVLGHPAAGPTGRGVLAYFDISPRPGLGLRATAGNGVLAHMEDVLKLSTAADVQGGPIAVMDGARTFIVVRRLVGDLNKDCKVDLLDDQAISARFPSTFGMLAYDPQYDLEPSLGDGDIDVKDTQLVFGRNGNTCDHPGPSETPPPEETPTIPSTSTPAPPRTPTPTPEASSTRTSTAVTTEVATSTPVPTRTSTPTAGGTRTATAQAGSTQTPSAGSGGTSTPRATGTAGHEHTPAPGMTATATHGGGVLPAAGGPTPAPRFLPQTGRAVDAAKDHLWAEILLCVLIAAAGVALRRGAGWWGRR